jgi:hypothetical protein
MLTLSQLRSKWDSHDSRHLGVPSSASNTISKPTVHSTQTGHQSFRIELPLEPCHLGVPSSASKTISMSMVCSVQTVHLSCTDTNTVSKRTKTRFHMTHVTYEFHRVHPQLFVSLWYLQCKHAPILCQD